jgi:REP element-mobilizing transposase RayT
MPKGLRPRYGLRHLHFITCSCYRRLPLFASARAKNLFVRILGEVRDRYGFALAVYIVMPNRIHLLIGEPAKGDSFHRYAGVDATRVAPLAPQAATAGILSATETAPPRFTRTFAAVLAVPLLRFQRLESDQVRGWASL